MIDIQKQIGYWLRGAVEDFPVGLRLIKEGCVRHGLFFIHLALEKIIKAHVCRKTGDLAPRSHNLTRLAELTGITFSKNDLEFIAEMNTYNIEGRYPDSYDAMPDFIELEAILTKSERIYKWLHDQL